MKQRHLIGLLAFAELAAIGAYFQQKAEQKTEQRTYYSGKINEEQLSKVADILLQTPPKSTEDEYAVTKGEELLYLGEQDPLSQAKKPIFFCDPTELEPFQLNFSAMKLVRPSR